jgi:uncharacterized protein (TIGR02284 family)
MNREEIHSMNTATNIRDGSSRDACTCLNHLIVACFDDINAQRAAASIVRGDYAKNRLEDAAARRASFIHELSTLVTDLGGQPQTKGSMGEGIRSAVTWVRTLVTGPHYGEAYSTATRIERRTESSYELARVDGSLSAKAREVVLRQHEQISSDCKEWTNLQM